MNTHVKVLGVLYIVFSALGLLAALFAGLALGSVASIVGATADFEDAAIAVPILGFTGMALAIFLSVLSLPGLLTGWGLLALKPWARILGIVLSALQLLNVAFFPVSTALAIYGLWVLFNSETERLFNTAAALPRA
jgi:hypothetical protein